MCDLDVNRRFGPVNVRYIDISMAIYAEMRAYDGDPPVELSPWSRRSAGDDFNVTALRLGSHTGTHVDAPSHCINGGATLDELSLDVLCGPVFVLDLAAQSAAPPVIPPEALDAVPAGTERLILRTRSSGKMRSRSRQSTGSALGGENAQRLIESGIHLIGIDQLSIAPPEAELAVHRTLLEAGVIILEGLELASVREGPYELLCLPLKLSGSDGSPVRAVLDEV
jgi:arylformamidase